MAAERVAAKGMSVVLFEKKELGGVCLNEGCIPTKTLLYSAKLYDNAVGGAKYGVNTREVDFDYTRIIDRKNKVVRKLVAGVAAKMKAHDVKVIKGAAMIEGRSQSGITIAVGEEKFFAKNLLVSTGSEAFVPPIPGIATAGQYLMTNRELLASKECPRSLVIIGGGVIGMEFASFFNSLGTEVTVVEMLPEILGGTDPEISLLLREIYTKKGVKFNLGCRVTAIDGNRVEYTDTVNGTHSLEADRILISVGRRPVTAGFGLENIGVQIHKGGIKVDERMRTNIPNVFAAGDVTGFSMLAHTASREAEVVVNNLTGRRDVMRYNAIPGVVYTNPEVAAAGHTLESARAAGLDAVERKLPMAYTGRFVAENEGVNGLCKVIVGREHGEVLGVHMIGNPCSEIIYGACMAIEQEMTVTQLEEVVFPHPTVSEIVREALFTAE